MLTRFLTQFSAYWDKLPRSQKLVVGSGVLLGVVLIGAFLWWASTPDYAVAFTGLAESDAGAIAEQLQADGVDYKVESGGTILVPSTQVNDVRLSIANKGLLGGSTVGFELFNSSALGLSEFNQRVNYQRALEGELARTIESLGPVEAARVHIVIPKQELFVEQQKPPTAAITIQLAAGKQLSPMQVQSVMHLVASGVEGLQPSDVVIVDTGGNMLSAGFAGEDEQGVLLSAEQRAAQRAYEAQVEAKVQDMLEQALGPNRSIVRVSAEMDWDTVEVVQQSYDPDSVVRSAQTVTETYTGAADQAGGIPGAESNLPDDEGAPTYQQAGEGGNNIDYSRTETTTNYEVATVETRTVVAPGEVETLSVSVLVDDVTDTDTLAALSSIAVLAAGVDEDRGDEITVQSIQFDRTFEEERAAEFEAAGKSDLYKQIAMLAAIVIGLVAVLLYSQRLIRNLRLRAEQDVWTTVLLPPGLQEQRALAGATAEPGALPGAAAGAPRPAALPAGAETGVQLETEAAGGVSIPTPPPPPFIEPVPELPLPFEQTSLSPEMDSVQRAVERIAERQPLTVAEIIRLWLVEDDP